jgi:prophage regulatory protein
MTSGDGPVTALARAAAPAPVRLIRLPEVLRRTGLSKVTVWRWRRAGDFPRPVRLSPTVVGWVESEIDAWIAKRITARDAVECAAPVASRQRR